MVKKLLLIFPLFLLLIAVSAGAHDRVEDPRACQQCGMDRTVYAHSRMLIVYADGSQTGICSLTCAANELKEHRGNQMTDSKIESAKKLLASGMPPRGVAKNLGVSIPTLYRWIPAAAQT
jgi:hypothetical protein